jgi:hypothetical protein
MRARLLLGVFREEEGLVRAVRAMRAANVPIHDAYAPYPIHGLDEAMGLARSRLPWVTAAGALVGVSAAALGQWWTHSVDWAIDLGGKPFFAWPAYVPVMFEAMILLAGLSTAAGLFVASRLWPNPAPKLVHHGVTHDTFVIALADRDGSFDRPRIERILRESGAIEIDDGGEA